MLSIDLNNLYIDEEKEKENTKTESKRNSLNCVIDINPVSGTEWHKLIETRFSFRLFRICKSRVAL